MGIDLKKIKNHLITGMSCMVPMTVIDGIFYAGSIVFRGITVAGEGTVIKNEFLLHAQGIGGAGLFLVIPILAGYIAYAIAGKPVLASGLVAGYIADTEITIGRNAVKTRFLGALILDLMTGYLIRYMKKMHYPELIKSAVPILIIPVAISFIACILYMYILVNPIGMAMGEVESFLTSLSGGSRIVLGIIMGMMVTVDMGGPTSKTACLFSIGIVAEEHYELFDIRAIPVCTAPLGVGLTTLLAKNEYTQEERDAGRASLFTGLIGISKGAVPLAVADPAKVIPSTMAGGVVGGAIAAIAGVEDYAPHGEPIVLPIIDKKIWLVIAVIVGTLVTAILVNLLEKPVAQTELASK